MEDTEGKPPGTLPILEMSRPETDKPGRCISQSSAILEYLEDVYGHEGPDMRGETPEARARARECMDAANEATMWLVLYVQNGSSMYAQMREQNIGVAEEGSQRLHKALSLLERLADPNSRYLVGDTPTIADCILVATLQFADALYGIKLGEKHPRLQPTLESFEESGTAKIPAIPEMMTAGGMHVK